MESKESEHQNQDWMGNAGIPYFEPEQKPQISETVKQEVRDLVEQIKNFRLKFRHNILYLIEERDKTKQSKQAHRKNFGINKSLLSASGPNLVKSYNTTNQFDRDISKMDKAIDDGWKNIKFKFLRSDSLKELTDKDPKLQKLFSAISSKEELQKYRGVPVNLFTALGELEYKLKLLI